MTDHRLRGVSFGLGSAVLFGASTPLAKLLLGDTGPLLLGGLLYLGAGVGLSLLRWAAPRITRADAEAHPGRADALPLAGIVVFGGVLGPVLLLVGLQRLSGLAGSLLLNLEAPLTMALAVLLFREHLSRREVGAGLLVTGGALLLCYRPGAFVAGSVGVAAVAGACLCWAIDNNLTARLSLRDPIAVTRVKTLAAGTTNLLIALLAGSAWPSAAVFLPALVVGSLGYGVSTVLYIHALRDLGAARQAVYFATAPFAGALLAVPILGERPTVTDALAAAVMLAGIALLVGARHGHLHVHDALRHDHAHVHDEHHPHAHDGPGNEPHSHWHEHEALTHEHAHVSDPHHRHRH